MSASRCVSCLSRTARSTQRIQLQLPHRPLIQSRSYAQVSDPSEPVKQGSQTIEAKQQPTIPASKPKSSKQSSKSSNAPSKESVAPTARTEVDEEQDDSLSDMKPLPPNVIAAFRTPYRHPRTHGIPVASLQLRSYSVRNLEFFADFCMRIAYYLKLPASGPVPLPKKTERWTTIRSNFAHKKSQENFERVTLRRMITIYDGNVRTVEMFLAAVRKYQFYGVGMKANVWRFEELDVAKSMEKMSKGMEKRVDKELGMFGWNQEAGSEKSIEEMLQRQGKNVVGSPALNVREPVQRAQNADLFRDLKD